MKEKIAFSLSALASSPILVYLLVFLLPTQFGRHFWPSFSFVSGIRLDYLSPILYVTDLLILLILMQFLPRVSRTLLPFLSRIPIRQKLYIGSFLGALVLFVMGNCFFSVLPLLALYGWVKWLEFFLLGSVFISLFRNPVYKRQLLFWFVGGIFLQALLALAQVVHGGSLGGPFYFLGERFFAGDTPGIATASIYGQLYLRPYGTLPHPNVLAAYLVIGMFFIQSLLPLKKLQQTIFSFLSLFFFVTVLVTLSRTAILLGVLAGGYTLYRQGSKRVAFISLFVIFCTALIFFPLLLGRFSALTPQDEAVVTREYLLQASHKIILTHPITGVGLYNFLPSLSREFPTLPYSLLQPVHSVIPLLLSELGIPFFLVLCFLSTLLTRSLSRHKQYEQLLLLGVVFGFGLTDHFLLTLQQGQLLLTLVLSFVISEALSMYSISPTPPLSKAKMRKIREQQTKTS